MAMMGSGAARGEERAMEAAEKAISNPLLDDVNLNGANGILVNITAGPDFTMREFHEVGSTIEGLASEDATVVIGTVLDPDMQDEVRVTVVATGLNRAVARQPVRGVDREPVAAPRPVRLVRDATTGQPIYPDAMPVAATPNAPATPAQSSVHNTNTAGAMDYLDIPSFLRRQAD
jgi:cell division protein FtsZ